MSCAISCKIFALFKFPREFLVALHLSQPDL